MIWLFIGIFAFLGLIVLLAYMTSKDSNTKNRAIDYTVLTLYMENKIDVNTYISATLPSSDIYKMLHSYQNFEKYSHNELYSDEYISTKVDNDLKLS